MDRITKEKLLGPPFVAPVAHVVILGAGASRAAFPTGDRNGHALPLIDDLAAIVGPPWYELLDRFDPPVGGFEAQFSWLRRLESAREPLVAVERSIIEYFAELELPEAPTIYDYLVLGLRPKDTIATFNWDPLLLAAHVRNRHVAKLPEIRFLHGSVSYFTCATHDVLGSTELEVCPHCRVPLESTALFFPESEKDYTKDYAINREWRAVDATLRRAFHLTIFGYSGPRTDYNARKLLLEAWTETPLREVTHVEIIDIADDAVLQSRWRDFIPFHHDLVYGTFWESTVAKYPRRTAEYKLSASLYGLFTEPIGPFRTDSLRELQDWYSALGNKEE